MAKKKNKTKPSSARASIKPVDKHKTTSSGENWGLSVLYGVIGGALYYFISPILLFQSAAIKESAGIFTFLSALLAFAGSTKIFTRYISGISYFVIALTLVQILANVMLTYEWIKSNELLFILANSFSLPLGIIWYFILKNKAFSATDSTTENIYSFKEEFKKIPTRILAIVFFLLCGILLFYRLGYYDIWEDENLVINAAIGLQENGLDYLKDGYSRTWLHSLLISGFFDVFGVSEFNGRLPSALFGLMFVAVCYYVFTRWYGIGVLAILLPVVCLMNDRFLILFRYMRMYAPLIPMFILGIYLFYRTLTIQDNAVHMNGKRIPWITKRTLYTGGSLFFLLLLAHLHKLTMIVLPVFFIFIAINVLQQKSKVLKYALYGLTGGGLVVLFLAFIIKLDFLRMFPQAANRILSEHQFFPVYYTYMLENGLPVNSTVMSLIAGTGLLSARLSNSIKSILTLSYLLITIALVSMIYLIAGEGRDYRYIAHIVPFVVGISLFVWYQVGNLVWRKFNTGWMFVLLMISALHLLKDYSRVYVRHPWAPSYSVVYHTLIEQYKEGDALFAQNIKTYYLDPFELAGDHYHKIPKKSDYNLEQFKTDVREAKRGWFMWEQHKSHYWNEDVLKYIYSHFKNIHGGKRDDLGVDLFYFDESMID